MNVQAKGLSSGPPPYRYNGVPAPDSGPWRTVLYTPGVINTPRTVAREVDGLWAAVIGAAVRTTTWYVTEHPTGVRPPAPDLVIVDEADRLKTASLEQLRDFYDRRHVGVVLIGMPGLQKRLARYAQLYSRVGNFRLVERLFAQIERIVAINGLPSVTTEVVTLARERLVLGPE